MLFSESSQHFSTPLDTTASALETMISVIILILLQQNVCLLFDFSFNLSLVSSFNIQVFGTTKYGKEPVKNQIVEILQRYDIATIQAH